MKCGTEAVNTNQSKKGYNMYLCPKCKIMFVGNIRRYSLKTYLNLTGKEMIDMTAYYNWNKHKDHGKYTKEVEERKKEIIKKTFGEEVLILLKRNI